jgi:hypothetical protein
MAQPLATSGARSSARQSDAVGVEPFCGVQIGFEQKRSLSQARSLQKGGRGETCGLAFPADFARFGIKFGPKRQKPQRCEAAGVFPVR